MNITEDFVGARELTFKDLLTEYKLKHLETELYKYR